MRTKTAEEKFCWWSNNTIGRSWDVLLCMGLLSWTHSRFLQTNLPKAPGWPGSLLPYFPCEHWHVEHVFEGPWGKWLHNRWISLFIGRYKLMTNSTVAITFCLNYFLNKMISAFNDAKQTVSKSIFLTLLALKKKASTICFSALILSCFTFSSPIPPLFLFFLRSVQ